MRTTAFFLLVASAWAQSVRDRTMEPYVRATATATISAKPDRARLDIGVVTQAITAEAAGADNATRAESLMKTLHRSLGSAAQIRTSGYSLTPNFRYPKDGSEPVLTGYTASNTVEITTDDLANLGKLIDAGTQAGANNVRGIEFLLKDEGPVRAQALKEAAQKARSSAEAMAAALGVRVVRVLSAEEGAGQVIRPMMHAMAARAQAEVTPIEAGDIQVQATVTVTLEVAQ
jgi:uncharacterized protein